MICFLNSCPKKALLYVTKKQKNTKGWHKNYKKQAIRQAIRQKLEEKIITTRKIYTYKKEM